MGVVCAGTWGLSIHRTLKACMARLHSRGVLLYSSPGARPLAAAGAVQIEDLRLAGGPSASEGRVELRLTNSSAWGTLCSTWSTYSDATVARVICRELGFEPAQALARGGGIYGSGGLEPVAAGGCGGEEEALEECQLRLVSGGDPSPCPALGVSCNGALL